MKPTATPNTRLPMRFYIDLYTFIHDWQKEYGQPPSLTDLFDFECDSKPISSKSKSVQSYYLKIMEKLGMIEREKIKPGRSTLKLLPPSNWNPIVREEIKDGEKWLK